MNRFVHGRVPTAVINYELHTAMKFGKLIRDDEWITLFIFEEFQNIYRGMALG